MNSNIAATAYWGYNPPTISMLANVTPYLININQSVIGGTVRIYNSQSVYSPSPCLTSTSPTPNTCILIVPLGSPTAILAIPNPGWKFIGWTGIAYNKSLQSTNISAFSGTVTANFAPIKTYNLTINSPFIGPFGSHPEAGTYKFLPNSSLNIWAVSGYGYGDVDYTFTHWNGSGIGSYTGTNDSATITMDSTITENASYTRCYTLTLLGSGGIENANPVNSGGCPVNEYVYGTPVSITATPSIINSWSEYGLSEYVFRNWSGVGAGSINSTKWPLNIKMVGNIEEIAHYSIANIT
jgi:hypothetical protein